MITHFKPTLTKSLPSLAMPTLHTALAPLLPSEQHSFLSVRVDGVFNQVAFRVMPAPHRDRQSPSDLSTRQQLQSVHNVPGLVFGFWSPGCSNSSNVAGFHLHFISDDRTAGGHVTGFDAWDVKLSAGVLKEYGVELPQDEDFLEVPIRNYEEDQNLH
ncbi:alpha-acetolactate decarboxylase [Aspergillus nomiae NRRL 13137]|uniref:Alpha-acetolactate decarboxylase n=1 Tax=Aspergillus nomiae NRRL (strain ATCC 15546 / NRRL 13137 / CBS 260.88 / M93) TaxID=1509407 RepID=A0A0L1J6M2_ASPN3|nr:alpha-acetolactate decarboxylase [Aspergillus nomiae NRRL 13137]KNG87397.1 alpha-acetolactate decarboxylase [Aspergillus nomiae NRRL 13137]